MRGSGRARHANLRGIRARALGALSRRSSSHSRAARLTRSPRCGGASAGAAASIHPVEGLLCPVGGIEGRPVVVDAIEELLVEVGLCFIFLAQGFHRARGPAGVCPRTARPRWPARLPTGHHAGGLRPGSAWRGRGRCRRLRPPRSDRRGCRRATRCREVDIAFDLCVIEHLAEHGCLVAGEPVGADDTPRGHEITSRSQGERDRARSSGSVTRAMSPYDVLPGVRSISSSNAWVWARTGSPFWSPTVLMHSVGTHASLQPITREPSTLKPRNQPVQPCGEQTSSVPPPEPWRPRTSARS